MTTALPLEPSVYEPLDPAPDRRTATAVTPHRRRRLMALVDASVALAVILGLASWRLAAEPGVLRQLPWAAVLAVLWLALLTSQGAFARHLLSPGASPRSVLRAGAAFPLVCLVVVYAGGTTTVGPLDVLLLTAAVTAVTLAAHVALDLLRRPVRVVVAGHAHVALPGVTDLRATRSPVHVVGACLTGATEQAAPDLPVVDGFDRAAAWADQLDADAVIVTPCEHLDAVEIRRLAWDLEKLGPSHPELYVGTALGEPVAQRATIGHAGRRPVIHVRPAADSQVCRVVKAVWERAAALLALVVLAPVLLLIAALVRLDSPGPALFRQTRVGKDGAGFTMLKFRTMGTDAEQRLHALADAASGSVLFKLRVDPRITRVGKVLRRYSLDELPQLVNVVRGEMALIGPRPALPHEVEQYEPDTRRRLAVTPGLTGLWQVSGRSDLSWEESVRLDLHYVDNHSLGLDLQILLRTVRAVLSHRGAY